MRRIRMLAALVLSVSAVVAAMDAAPASASGLVAHNYESAKDEYPALISMKPTENYYFEFGNAAGGLICSAPSLLGHTTMQGASRAVSASIETESKACELIAQPEWKANWFVNGCGLTFHPGAETSAGHFAGTYDIGGSSCSSGMQIKAIGWECTITIPPQSGIEASFVNHGAGKGSTVSLTQSGALRYESAGKASANCPSNGVHENGRWSATLEASASNEAGETLGLATDASAPTGFYLESGEFKGESYPLQVGGDPSKGHAFEFHGGEWSGSSCETNHFLTVLSAASSSFAPAMTIANCSSLVGESRFSSTIAMNSCHYAFEAGGTLGVSCTSGGDAITVTTPMTGCVISIGAQKGLSGLSLTNVGSGGERGVKATVNVSGVTYTASKGLLSCGVLKGTHTDGSYTGTITFYGGVAG